VSLHISERRGSGLCLQSTESIEDNLQMPYLFIGRTTRARTAIGVRLLVTIATFKLEPRLSGLLTRQYKPVEPTNASFTVLAR
jgi:hypothetical protein